MNSNLTDTKKIRQFGTIALIFFGCLGAVGFILGRSFPSYFFSFLAIVGVGFILAPHQLSPLYCGWLKVAGLIGKATTAFVLTVAYYLVITPFALVMRLFGRRPLPVRPDKEVSSYWVDRTEPAQQKERFRKRF